MASSGLSIPRGARTSDGPVAGRARLLPASANTPPSSLPARSLQPRVSALLAHAGNTRQRRPSAGLAGPPPPPPHSTARRAAGPQPGGPWGGGGRLPASGTRAGGPGRLRRPGRCCRRRRPRSRRRRRGRSRRAPPCRQSPRRPGRPRSAPAAPPLPTLPPLRVQHGRAARHPWRRHLGAAHGPPRISGAPGARMTR